MGRMAVAIKHTAGQRIRILRLWRDLTIRELAGECGLKRSAIHRMENEKQFPREAEINEAARGLRVTWAEFYDDAFIARAIRETKARTTKRAA